MPLTQTEATTIPSTGNEPVANKSCVSSSQSSIKSRQRRILVVGDGNFSYSLSLIKQHHSRVTDDQPIHLTATSYDSYEELIAKYPESKRICAQLRELDVTVLHRVDATNLRESLVAAGAKQKLRFHSVIFNHPHCGEENVRRHQSLLSHFYASALNVLEEKDEDDASGIQLTLAEGQPERWQAVPRALSGGLKLYRKVDDVDNDETFGVVYERKRHQNGKSFHQVTLYGEKKTQSSTLFIFRRQTSPVEAAPVDTAKTTDAPVVGGDEVMTVSRKRKAEREQSFEFACTQCDRSFKSAQGLRTHVHMMHELEAGGVQQEKVRLHCKFCSRTFNTEDARRQHQLAKHGKDPLIKPDWFRIQQHEATIAASESMTVLSSGTNGVTSPTTSVAVIAKPKACAICAFSFATVEDFDAHWQKLQPRAAVKRQCSNCGREFDEERALRQHQNFCSHRNAAK
uniref:C2H2-type domain-containing protein n=1 Tax=Peronospora matthiolae TaxID=2874970 RepID=A0AAV1UBT5_9STRA